jgi:hypothetical protein
MARGDGVPGPGSIIGGRVGLTCIEVNTIGHRFFLYCLYYVLTEYGNLYGMRAASRRSTVYASHELIVVCHNFRQILAHSLLPSRPSDPASKTGLTFTWTAISVLGSFSADTYVADGRLAADASMAGFHSLAWLGIGTFSTLAIHQS